jgi:hypothetical protein
MILTEAMPTATKLRQKSHKTLATGGKSLPGDNLLNTVKVKKCDIDTIAQCYKTFYGHNLQIFVLSYSV